MRVFKSIVFILLVVLAQAIVSYLEFRYLSITLGMFALILIVFVQGLQMILEYHIFSKDIKVLPKLFYGIIIIAIMVMNVNYLELSRKAFDVQDDEEQIEKIYQDRLEHYNELMELYNNELEAHKNSIQTQMQIFQTEYDQAMASYKEQLNTYKDQKAFYEEEIATINKRIDTLQKSMNRWGMDDDEKAKVRTEIDRLSKQKLELLDNYKSLKAPVPPKKDSFEVEKFDKEPPVKPKREDIVIEKDARLELLYWLIAGIMELGSLALLFLLNNTINNEKYKKAKKYKESKEPKITEDFESKIEEYIEKTYNKKIENTNDEEVDQKEIIAKNQNVNQSEKLIEDTKEKDINTHTENENGENKNENKQDIDDDIIKEISQTMTSSIDEGFEKDAQDIIEENDKNQNIDVKKSVTLNGKVSNNISFDIEEEEETPDESEEMKLPHINNNDNEITDIDDDIDEISIDDFKPIQSQIIDNTKKSNKITESLEQINRLQENTEKPGENEHKEEEPEENAENESINKNNNNVIYVYKENSRDKLIKQAVEELRNMTIFQRKVFAEKLSKILTKNISFKTLGVWSSRDYIPAKKVDAVLKALGLVDEKGNVEKKAE